MQQGAPLTLACGGTSTSRHDAFCNYHPFPLPLPAHNSCLRLSGGPRKARVPHTNLLVLTVHGVLLFIVTSAWGEVGFAGATAQSPSERPQVHPALSLARDMTARRVNFQNTPYGGAGPQLKFSPTALNDLAGRLFPARADALKKQKFLEIASRINLSHEVLDLTSAYKVLHARDRMEKATKRFGRAPVQLQNPLSFSNAVRTAFHKFVRKQELKAMAEMYSEDQKLASRLETVDVTPELRHLIASALPAVQPSKPTADEKAALNNIARFYGDLDATRQRLFAEAMEKIDTTTPVPTSSLDVKSSADQPALERMKAVIKEVQTEARERVDDAYYDMSPAEKLDLAAAGLSSAQLTEAVTHKLLENAMRNSPEDFGNKTMVKEALDEVMPKSQTNVERAANPVFAKSLTALTLASIVALTATYISRKRRKHAERRRTQRRRRPKVEEVSLDLDLGELISMPLPALEKRAFQQNLHTKAEAEAGTPGFASEDMQVKALSFARSKYF